MADMDDRKNSDFSFMKEKIKQKPIYQNRMVQKCIWAVILGALFGVAALGIWAAVLPKLNDKMAEQEIQPIEIPEEPEPVEEEEPEAPVYITEKVSMELDDYKRMYQQLIQLGSQTEKSLADITVVTVDTDWFDETYTSQKTATGIIIGDNGLELLLLAPYERINSGGDLQITFFDHTTAAGVIKKYDKNTGLAVVSVNLNKISQTTRDIILYADMGSSKTLRSGEPVIAVGSLMGTSGSILFGNLTSVSQMAGIYDGTCNVLTTDIVSGENATGVLVNWEGKIVGLIQDKYEVSAQKGTIQAYGISDLKSVIEHLSNNQDIVYMGITGADVTTSVSETEHIPIGVYVSEVALGSPAMEAGIQPGDVITSISGKPVTNLKDVMSILLKCSNEQNVEVTCQRMDKTEYQELDVSVTLKLLE